MKKLIFINFQNDDNIKTYLDSMLFLNEYSYKNFINNSNIHIYDTLIFEVVGGDYSSKKASLQDIAQKFYCMFMDCAISQGELLKIQDWLYCKAARFGLVKEFKENGII